MATGAEECTPGDKRNETEERSEGEIIVALDDDDHYHPEYMTRMAEQLLAV